jgi:apocytochrome f
MAGETVTEKFPGPDLLVREGQTVQADQPLTNNPNVGGFGQSKLKLYFKTLRVFKV